MMQMTGNTQSPPSPPPKRGLRALIKAAFSTSLSLSAPRMRLAALGFLALYGVVAIKLAYLGFKPEATTTRRAVAEAVAASRPDIVDRNGEVLASDVKVMSVFAEPRRLIDKDEATELLTAVLPDIDARELRERLGSQEGLRLGEARGHAASARRGVSSRPAGGRAHRRK